MDLRDETHRRNKIELERLTRVLAGRNSYNPANESGRLLIAKRQELERQIADYERLLEARQSSPEPGGLKTPHQPPERAPKSWQEIEITFLSDHRIDINCGGANRKTYNYADLGFQDRRDRKNAKPNRAWEMLREIAKRKGTIPRPSPGTNRAMIQKRMEEIREKLRGHFKNIEGDPIPFNCDRYQASFRISCGPSFET